VVGLGPWPIATDHLLSKKMSRDGTAVPARHPLPCTAQVCTALVDDRFSHPTRGEL